MRRAGVNDEKVCFIFDEGNVLESSFLEFMNALLASGDVPGLFEGDDLTALYNSMREVSTERNLMLDTEEELYKYFISRVSCSLPCRFLFHA